MKQPQPKKHFQIKRLFGLAAPKAAAAGMDTKEFLEDLANSVTRRTSQLSELTFDEANACIVSLGGVAFQLFTRSKRTENYRKQQLGIKTIETDAQLRYIDELAAMRNWTADSLRKFCNTVIKKDSPTTTEEGNKIVEGLKAMNQRDGLISFPMQKPARSKGVSTEPKFRRVA